MTVEERVLRCRIIGKIKRNEVYAKKLGITNTSSFLEKREMMVITRNKKESL